jgi:hypothetical protein
MYEKEIKEINERRRTLSIDLFFVHLTMLSIA